MMKAKTKESTENKKHRIFSLRTVAFAVAALIFGYGIYTLNAENLMGNKMPMPFGIGASIVLSGSMEPELSVDDMIVVKETQNVEVGDIAVYQDGSTLVVHRVIKIDGDKVTTKGDANNTADDPITKEQIKGVLMFSVPRIGVAVEFLRQPIVMLLASVIILLLSELTYKREQSADKDELSDIKREIEALRAATKETDKEEKN